MGDYEQSLLGPVFTVLLVALQFTLMTAAVLSLLVLPFAGLWLMYYCLTLPLRRAERARMFLDLLENTFKQGRPLEETIISLSHSGDDSMGLPFHVLAAWLEQGLSLDAALARVPYFLPPPATAMLRAGRQMGVLAQVLPAARRLVTDATSHVRGALNYLLLMTFAATPVGCYLVSILTIFVMPRFREVFAGMAISLSGSPTLFLFDHVWTLVGIQLGLMLLLWLAAFFYIAGARLTAWFPILERLHYRVSWRRKRMQRDFSTILAVLLDAGVPEAAALTLAADCSANSVFRRRAARAVEDLRQGRKLAEAVQRLDDAGEFRWRLGNAMAAPGGFLRALAGWHESLDARAFQQEQAAAQIITTSLVLWSGAFVGLVLVAFFYPLTTMITGLAIW
jgi:type II secretory pathway component PulF